MDIEKRFGLVKRNTAEIITEQELREVLKTKRKPRVYIGFASTGKIHVGYFIPLLKLKDFIEAGFEVTILLADVHASLDNLKTPWELLDHRFNYYREATIALFKSVGANVNKVKFVKGRDIQLNKEYMLDLLKLATLNNLNECRRAAEEVVKLGENPRLSGFIYPIMQALDEEYLDVDVQYGGLDQRKILVFARENLPKIGYKRRIEIMTPMLPGLTGGKMSSSEAKSKIDILDSEKDVSKKISEAYCVAGEKENNGVLAFVEYVIMNLNNKFVIERDKKFGGDLSYNNYEDLEKDFMNKKLHPQDLKNAVAREVNKLLEPIRKHFKGKEGIVRKAYPNETS